MDIVFGLWVDGGGWPDHGGNGNGGIGTPVVGPIGLLDILETARGLGAPSNANVVRIAAFQAALEKMGGPTRFWSRSLGVDGWATARTLLSWRDELIDAGWNPSHDWSSPRLLDIATAEKTANVPPGIADRVAAVASDLLSTPTLPIKRIRLIDAREVHSAGWRRLLDRLEACGVEIDQITPKPAAPEKSALGQLQRWMLHGGPVSGEPDGSITIATSASATLAAEITGQWFAERGDSEAVLIAQDSDTHLLDHGLRNAGQPRAGRSRASAHRGSLQILLLAFKVGWAPFDPRTLMELLIFPSSPIAPRAARLLAAALEEAPGRGGPRWTDAWEKIGQVELAEAKDDSAKVRKSHERLARWRAWADPELANPADGIPIKTALATCDRTISWAVARHSLNGDPLFQATANLANDVRKALESLGRSHLPRTLVERIIDQALDVGHNNPLAEAEAATWRSVPHPGGVWAPTSSVVWWNFRITQEGLQRSPWSNAERTELAAFACSPDDVALSGRVTSAAWERAIMNTRDHLLLITHGLDSRNEEALHPLAHRMSPATERLATRVRIEDALATEKLTLAGVELPRALVTHVPVPKPQSKWGTPTGYAARLNGTYQSATSFENLLACQLMWALKHVAKLRAGHVRSIPDANQLLGNLAHMLAREIFTAGSLPTPDEADRRARQLLDSQIDQLAAPLRLPELAAQLENARERLPSAMAELARTLAINELNVEATELQISRTFENALAVRGVVDLVARDKNGNNVIIDLKWTRNANNRINELKDGNAVQLATYGAMVAGDAPYRAGYFLLNQRQFATLTEGGLIGRSVEGGRGFPETWAAIRESWRQLTEVADSGALVARGVDGWEDDLPNDLPIIREVKCQWCDYQTLCRVRGLK